MSKSGTSASFVYNADGLRIQKTVNGAVTSYILHGKNIVHLSCGSDAMHFWYDAQGRPAVVEFNGAKFSYILNLQGDVMGLRDATGNEAVRYTYDAWGRSLSTAGSLASTLGYMNPFRSRGYVYDEETGMYYLRSRYYNPECGRFVNSDIILNAGAGVFSHNIFCYCDNNPLSRSDPSGHCFKSIFSSFIKAAKKIISFVANAIRDYTKKITIVDSTLITGFKKYSISNPLTEGVSISASGPKKLLFGEGRKKVFSGLRLILDGSLTPLDAKPIINYPKDSIFELEVEISINQWGLGEPYAEIFLGYYENYTITDPTGLFKNGARLTSFQIIGGDANGYWLLPSDGRPFYYEDEYGYVREIIDSIILK